MSEIEYQTRSSTRGLTFFKTMKEAVVEAESDEDLWKISYSTASGECFRWVRVSKHENIDSTMNTSQIEAKYLTVVKSVKVPAMNLWVNQPLSGYSPKNRLVEKYHTKLNDLLIKKSNEGASPEEALNDPLLKNLKEDYERNLKTVSKLMPVVSCMNQEEFEKHFCD